MSAQHTPARGLLSEGDLAIGHQARLESGAVAKAAGVHCLRSWSLPHSVQRAGLRALGFESSSLLDSSGTTLEVDSAVVRRLPAKEIVVARPWRSTRPTSAPARATPRRWFSPARRPSRTPSSKLDSVHSGSTRPTSAPARATPRRWFSPAGARLRFTSRRRFLSGSEGGLGPAGGCKPLVLREYEVRFLRSPPRRGPSASLLPLKLSWWSAALVARKSRFDSGQGLRRVARLAVRIGGFRPPWRGSTPRRLTDAMRSRALRRVQPPRT